MFNFLSPLYWIFVFLLFGFLGGSKRTYQKLVHRSLPLSRVGDYSAILGGPWAGGAGLKLGCWICQAPCSGIIFFVVWVSRRQYKNNKKYVVWKSFFVENW